MKRVHFTQLAHQTQ